MSDQMALGLDEFGRLVSEGLTFRVPERMAPLIAARLGNPAVEEREGAFYVLASPFSFEREMRFRGALQLRRLVGAGAPVMIVPSEPYEADKGLTAGQAIRQMAEDAVAALRVLSADGQGVLWTRGRPYLFYKIRGTEGVPEFLLNAIRETSRVDGTVMFVGDGRLGEVERAVDGIRRLGIEVSVSVQGGEKLIYGFVEGEVKAMEGDPVSSILRGRELDIEPEASIPPEAKAALSVLDRID